MLSLHLFGGLSLTSSDTQVPARASQRRRLALLAVLAVSRRRPVTRDRLVALLWPDSDSERGRHLLADSIYVLRDALGEDVLLTTGENVSLNRARVSSDVGEFGDAVERHDFARAVAIYSEGGRFLDGVHVPDAPEFERWADATSRQLEGDYRRALEELAKAGAARGDHQESIRWWRKLAGEDRASSRVALELMRALEASGDIAGAVEFAGVHEKIVRAEIDTAPDPSVIAFANELRARPEPIRTTPKTASHAEQQSTLPETTLPTPAPLVSIPDTPKPGQESIAPRRSYRRKALISALAIVIVLAVGYRSFRSNGAARISSELPDRGPSIAVLPLRSVTPGADNESFADAMTEGLIASLSKIGGLRVIASTSAFAFKGHPTDIRVIADSLRVSNVLEGAVRRSGSRIRLSVRLVDAADGSTRWSDTYDRDVKDFLTVEDEIGKSVAGHLSLLLAVGSVPRTRPRTTVVKAYDLYLRGRHQRELRGDTALKLAMDYFSQAIAADSTYAAAYAALSEACTTQAFARNSAEFPRKRLLACGEAAASKALQLDDSLPEAHMALGALRLAHRVNLAVAEKELMRALQLDPGNRQAHEYMAIVFNATERPELGLAEARRAEALDPLSVTAIREVGRALYFAGRYDDALVQLNRARSMGPTVRNIPILAAEVYARKKMFSHAIAELQHAPPQNTFTRALRGHIYGLSGNGREASRIVAESIAQFNAGSGSAFSIAVVYAGLRDYDKAFYWLDKSFEDSSIRVNIMSPIFNDFRADPRFRAFRPRLGLPPS